MATETISLEFIGRLLEQVQADARSDRARLMRIEEGQLTLLRVVQALDRRLSDVKEELEGTIKIELGGALANLETRSTIV